MMHRRKVLLLQWVGLVLLLQSTAAFVVPASYRASSFLVKPPPLATRLFVAEDTDITTPEQQPAPPSTKRTNESRVRRIKDLMWIRETFEDLTAAEFAINLDQTTETSRRRKRAVDYDNLLNKLNRRIMDLGCEPKADDCQLEQIVELVTGVGMGSIVYSDQQRTDLFK